MAELTFVGAAGTVTGSKHLVSTGGKHFYVDCGMFQGPHDVVALNAVPLPIAPAATDAIVLTHGHIDHVGYLPKIVHDGYRGKIYCTPATSGLIPIVLNDAAHLQEMMAKRGFAREPGAIAPFYDANDVAQVLPLLTRIPLETDFEVCGATMRYKNAGHILGSAFIDAHIENRHVIFSGDIGRYSRPLLFDPATLDTADVVVCETTYGDRVHPPDALGEFETALRAAVARGGPLVIPAFAVERTQDILYSIGVLQAKDPELASLGVAVDSPMAIQVDKLFADYPNAHKPFPNSPDAPFGCRNVTLAVTTDDSKALNDIEKPYVIIASSGMASGGRVLHHLHNRLPDPKATVLFVGYQTPGSLGSLLIGGAKKIRIFGDEISVQASVGALSGYSAHADRDELLRWLGTLTTKPHLYAVHGETAAASAFSSTVETKLGFTAAPGARGTTVQL